MRALVLAGVALAGPALAQPAAPPPPVRVCVPAAVLEMLVAQAARQPWSDVSALMDEVRQAARGFGPCEVPPAAPVPAAPTP